MVTTWPGIRLPPRTPDNPGGVRLPYQSGFFEINLLSHRSSNENLPFL
jgi:hypothetical protein